MTAPDTGTPEGANEVEIFLPAAPSETDSDREQFFRDAGALAADGLPVRVYVRGEDDWAFEQCDPVREILDINGDDALPITLLGPDIMGMYAYPPEAKIRRLAVTPRATPKLQTNACTPTSGGADVGPAGGSSPLAGRVPPKDSPVAQLWRQDPPEPRGPEMGSRRNLMGGDIGDGLPPA